ncbi:MAG TPA: hypothetical protein VM686_34205 [Polyangiaceae bacterium]|nr:hypothetical protein [Polyangiaceae bacterium]
MCEPCSTPKPAGDRESSGEATFDALRQRAPGLPILLWSGYGADQDISGMLSRGAAGFVQKPYSVAELSRAVADAMRGRVVSARG